MIRKLFGSSKNEVTQQAVALAKIKCPNLKFYDIEENPENLKEYMENCFGDETGSPRIASYEWNEPYVTKDWKIFINEMDTFTQALLSSKTDKIPDEYDWFAPLIGDWACDYDDNYDGKARHVKGEWIFRRVLEGAGIQDIFIFPSRATKEKSPEPDGEYGSSFRMFNKSEKCYDVCYTCDHCMKRLRFTKEGDKLVGKVLDEEYSYWIFSDITENSFRWENVMIKPDGRRVQDCEIVGKRIK